MSARTADISIVISETTKSTIELHVDLTVDLAREHQMLHNFEAIFKPTVSKQPGFIDVKLLKLDAVLGGESPQDANYRFVLRFENEDLRRQWVASQDHQAAWPAIEDMLSTKSFNVLRYKVI